VVAVAVCVTGLVVVVAACLTGFVAVVTACVTAVVAGAAEVRGLFAREVPLTTTVDAAEKASAAATATCRRLRIVRTVAGSADIG
jgi:hypothetical protein